MSAACPIYGFDVLLEPNSGVDVTALQAIFLEQAIEHAGLAAEAGAAVTGRYTVTRDGSQATDADRQAIARWAAGQSDIARCDVGPLVDLGPSA